MFLIVVQRDVETPGVSSISASHLEKLVIGHILSRLRTHDGC